MGAAHLAAQAEAALAGRARRRGDGCAVGVATPAYNAACMPSETNAHVSGGCLLAGFRCMACVGRAPLTEFFSDAKKIPRDEVTIFLPQDFFSCPKIFFLVPRFFFLAVKKCSCCKKKKSCGKEKTVLSLYQEKFSRRQKKIL